MGNYLNTYIEVIKCGFVDEPTVRAYVEQQGLIDCLLPATASFFYIVDASRQQYRFLGKQQESVSGYTNEEFLAGGLGLWIERQHPEEVEIITTKILPKFMELSMRCSNDELKRVQFQYNYRFQRKDGNYINLLEHIYVLEVDAKGRPALVLGNVVNQGTGPPLPVRAAAKRISKDGVTEIYYSKLYLPAETAIPEITARELDILTNLATGKTSKQIGLELNISPHTVDTHRRNLLEKLECNSVVELARIAYKNGLL